MQGGQRNGCAFFRGSIVVLLVCFGLLKFLEDDDDNTGYWPTNENVRALMRHKRVAATRYCPTLESAAGTCPARRQESWLGTMRRILHRHRVKMF
jgi:hypothetical protein